LAKFSPISSARLLADLVAAVDVGDIAQKAGHRILEGDPERVLVDGVDLVDGGEIVRIGRRRLVAGTLDRVCSVLRRELAIAVVALHASANLERPFGARRVRRPAFGEIGLDEFRVDRAGLETDETVEHPAQQALVRRGRSDVRVELAGIGRSHADDQALLLREGGRCEQRSRCDGDNELLHCRPPKVTHCYGGRVDMQPIRAGRVPLRR
jgi:hypothetical protein